MKKEVTLLFGLALAAFSHAQIALDDASNNPPYVAGEEYIQVGTPPGNQAAATNGHNGGFGFERWQRGGYGDPPNNGYNHIKNLPTSFNMGEFQFGLNATLEAFTGCDARRRLINDINVGEVLSFSIMAGGGGAGNEITQGWTGVEMRGSPTSNPGRDVFSIDNFGGGGDWEINHGGGTIHTGLLRVAAERLDVKIVTLGGDMYEVTITPYGGLPQVHVVSGYYSGYAIRTVQFYAFDTGTGDFYVNFLKVAAAEKSISGTVDLLDYQGDSASQSVVFEIRNVGSTTPLDSDTVALASNGDYTFGTTLAEGTYDITAKGSHWLRGINGSVTVSSSGAVDVDFSLVNGDCDDDNEVTLVDYGIMSASYGKSLGDAGYDARADLDGDDEVNLVDAGIISANFGQAGAE